MEEEVRGFPPTTHICIHGIDFVNLDLTRCTEYAINKGKLYGLRAYSKSLKRFVSVAIWYQDENQTDKWQIYFFRDAKNYAGLCDCQSTDFRKLYYHFIASFTAINLAKAACKSIGIPYSITTCKSVIHNAYMLERFICASGIEPNTWGY